MTAVTFENDDDITPIALAVVGSIADFIVCAWHDQGERVIANFVGLLSEVFEQVRRRRTAR